MTDFLYAQSEDMFSPYRKKVYQSLREKMKVLTVAGIYQVLEEKEAGREEDTWIGEADLKNCEESFFLWMIISFGIRKFRRRK